MVTIPTCDLLVVGAGPAGCSAAMTAASKGVTTLLIDSKARIGEPSHCGEFVPQRLFDEYDLDRACVMNRVELMETRVTSPASASVTSGYDQMQEALKRIVCTSNTPSSGFIIDRVRFDRDLAREASEKGAFVLCAARLIKRDQDAWIIRHSGQTQAVHPRLVIAADGAASSVASALGMSRPVFLRGVQVEAPLNGRSDRCLIYLDRDFVGGYGWVFPKKTSANVGLGTKLETGVSPVHLLDAFVQRLVEEGTIRQGRLAFSAGLIPVSGIRPELVRDRVLFCGDAAGLTHPITGAGIPQALVSGSLAGRLAADALISGSDKPLQTYEREVFAMYRGVIGHALSKRGILTSLWDKSDFLDLCEQTWIGFKGYRRRVRQA